MRRKLIQHGLSSLTVSLPRKWIKENNLSKGEEIEVEESSGKLVISTKKHYSHKKIGINISGSGKMLRKIIGATYKTGYDEVDITFSSFEELKAIQDLVREQFTGFEIINQTKDSIKIKNLSQINFEEFNNVLRRFYLVLLQVSEETYQALEKGDLDWLKRVTLLKKESDKFADFCRRAINLGFESEFKRTTPLYVIIEQLEKVVDRYTDLDEYLVSKKAIPNKEIIVLFKDLHEFIAKFYTLFYKFSLEKIIEFGNEKARIDKKIEIIINRQNKNTPVIILFERIINLVYDLNGPLMALYI